MFRNCFLLLCASTLLSCGHEIKSWPPSESERASGETVEIFKNDFVKPNEQSSSSLEYSAMARNRTFKNDLSLATRTYPLQAVKKLCASGPIIVKCVPAAASAAKVEVSAPEAFIQYMQVKESAGVLQLGYEDLQIFKKRGHSYVRFGKSGVELRLGDDASGSLQTVVTVSAPLPSGLEASTGAQLQFPKNPTVDAPFSLDLSSGAVFSWSGELRSPSKAEFRCRHHLPELPALRCRRQQRCGAVHLGRPMRRCRTGHLLRRHHEPRQVEDRNRGSRSLLSRHHQRAAYVPPLLQPIIRRKGELAGQTSGNEAVILPPV